MSDAYTVGELAELAHVSVRTLHHYDEIGLLRPGARTSAGHRRYGPAEVARLRQILFYRALDFGLDEIARLLDDPAVDAADHLREQHRMLRSRIANDQALIGAIEKELEANQMGIALSNEEQFEIFGTDQVSGEWAEEAEQRWGDTPAWAESQRRTAAYTKQDWIEIKAEGDASMAEFAAALASGAPADSPRAISAAEAARQHINTRFYECSHHMHTCLAEMYVADERFRSTYEEIAPGLAQYVHDAIVANAAAHS